MDVRMVYAYDAHVRTQAFLLCKQMICPDFIDTNFGSCHHLISKSILLFLAFMWLF